LKKIIETDSVPTYEAPAPHKRTAKILVDEETSGAKNLAFGVATYNPGEKADLHVHDIEESMYILDGQAMIKIGDKQYKLKKGMAVYIPPNERHMLENDGEELFRFVFIFTPAGPERMIKNTWKKL